MNLHFSIRVFTFIGIVVVLAGVVLAQRSSRRLLIVNGKAANLEVLQINGRSYVDIASLAQATDGSVSFQANRIVLAIPDSNGGTTAAGAAPRLSKEFSGAALVEIALMREWKGGMETMIRLQVPADQAWFQEYHDRAEEGLRMAKVSASTPPDHDAVQLLDNEFTSLANWAGNAFDARRALNATRTVSPDVLQNDQTLQKISNCAQFLSTMLVSGVFTDNPACH
jgi:hypothetical protein